MRKSILCVLIASLCLTLPVFGQKVTGTIRGIVTDPTGAVVPNAQVTAKNVSTGEERNATSNSAGEYSFPELTPGTYDVSVTGANFKEFVAKGVQLNVS